MKIGAHYQKDVTTQHYSGRPAIEGVEIKQIMFHTDDGGNFSELFRLEQGVVEGLDRPFEAKQVSLSVLVPQTIKAFHLHYNQEDLWYVSPYDRLLVNLIDLREDSPTFQSHIRLIMGGGRNTLLRIPNGVAHGAANVYGRDMTLIYATSSQFNPAAPDEHRLPWDRFGSEIWELTRG